MTSSQKGEAMCGNNFITIMGLLSIPLVFVASCIDNIYESDLPDQAEEEA